MSDFFVETSYGNDFVKLASYNVVSQRKHVHTPRRKQVLQCFQIEHHEPVAIRLQLLTEQWLRADNQMHSLGLTSNEVLHSTRLWSLSDVSFDTLLLINFIHSVRLSNTKRLTTHLELDEPAPVSKAEWAEEAKTFVAERGLEFAAQAALDALTGSFEDIKQVRLDFDPGSEEEDDHPWIRLYVQTGMDASSTLRARRQFYKRLNASISHEESTYFHLSFRLIS